MKIRVVSTREEIFTLNSNEPVVHLAFRPSNKDIFGLVETCPKIEVISYLNLTSSRSQNLLRKKFRGEPGRIQ
jgi:hypothetical protein